MEELQVVGQRIPKVDALDKVTGRAKYIQDVKLPGMLFGKIFYSKFAHARIAHIDISKAEKLPGVRVILTGETRYLLCNLDFIRTILRSRPARSVLIGTRWRP